LKLDDVVQVVDFFLAFVQVKLESVFVIERLAAFLASLDVMLCDLVNDLGLLGFVLDSKIEHADRAWEVSNVVSVFERFCRYWCLNDFAANFAKHHVERSRGILA
jgi:hypothetical protein